MSTYLFAWNPKRWIWTDLDAQIEQVGLAGQADDRWSSGNTKQIPPGSRFFLIRLGLEPKGIIGSGVTLSAPDYGPHWDEDKAASGSETLYCDIRFDYLSEDVLVTWEELQQSPFSSFRWGVQASGISIPTPVAEALEVLWQSRTAGAPGTPSASISTTLPEGAKRKIVVNAYERNPLARAVCIAHHGHRCQVCGMTSEKDLARLQMALFMFITSCPSLLSGAVTRLIQFMTSLLFAPLATPSFICRFHRFLSPKQKRYWRLMYDNG